MTIKELRDKINALPENLDDVIIMIGTDMAGEFSEPDFVDIIDGDDSEGPFSFFILASNVIALEENQEDNEV